MPRIDKKYIKDPGALVHKIDIQRKTVSKPVKGIIEEVWETIYSPRCSVSNATGKEYYKEATEQYGVESKKFTFRTNPRIAIKQKDIIIYNETADAGIITINVKGVFPQDEASYLNSKGICVRSGEHCAKLLKDLLKTVGTIRISFYFYNTFEEIDTLYEALKNGGDFLDAYFN